jgi:hypothetical protein
MNAGEGKGEEEKKDTSVCVCVCVRVIQHRKHAHKLVRPFHFLPSSCTCLRSLSPLLLSRAAHSFSVPCVRVLYLNENTNWSEYLIDNTLRQY